MMKRSVKLIREMLPRLAQYEGEVIEDDQARYHIEMLVKANLVEALSIHGDGDVIYTSLELTLTGHDLLSVISSREVWSEMNKRAEDNELDIDSLPLEVIQKLGNEIMLSKLGV